MSGLYFKDPTTQQWTYISLIGLQGPTGPVGPAGPAGTGSVTGPTGPTGLSGGVGLLGPTGPSGAAGAQGPAGPQGTPGAKGQQGAQGPAGGQGPQGVGGPQGGAGPAGADHGIQFRVGMATVAGGTNVQGAWTAFSSPYGGTPALAVSMRTSTPGDIYVNCTHTGLNNAGFYPVVYRTNGTNCLVDWWAVKLRGTLLSAEEQAADANARAYHHDVSQHVWFVQTVEGGGTHELVEADHFDAAEEPGTLTLYGPTGDVIRQYEAGEWTSVQHEYVVNGKY